MKEIKSDIEYGEFHEKRFKEYLDNHAIPFLHIDQGPSTDKHSYALKDSNAKRPDFLLHLSNIGHVFVDVKSRTKKSFSGENEEMFSISIEDIDSLFSTQSYLQIPLWIAFTEKESNNPYYLIPITFLKQFKDKIRANLPAKIIEKFNHVRVPNRFVAEIDEITFVPKLNSYNLDCFDSYLTKLKETLIKGK